MCACVKGFTLDKTEEDSEKALTSCRGNKIILKPHGKRSRFFIKNPVNFFVFIWVG